MSYSMQGLDAAITGVVALGTHLGLHTADPGLTGVGEDDAVPRLPAGWEPPTGGAADSAEVPFVIAAGGGQRIYTHFSVWSAVDGTGEYVTGGVLDEPEVFSDNGGTYNFTATLSASSAA